MEKLTAEAEQLKKSKSCVSGYDVHGFTWLLLQHKMKFRASLQRRNENVKSELKRRSVEFGIDVDGW